MGLCCQFRTHNETVKKLTLFSAFDQSNHDGTTALAPFSGNSSEIKCDKTTLSRHLINETWKTSEEETSLYLLSAK